MRKPLLILMWIGGLWGTGCQIPMPTSPPQLLPAGGAYLLHLPGVAGYTPLDQWWVNAIKSAGAADCAEVFDWTCHDGGLNALQAYARNRAEARILAKRIVSRVRCDPSAKVIVTAQSGGTAVAVWALEDLPADVQVEATVLVAPALSANYDLSAALRHVKKRMYAFTSPGDVIVLGAGTRVFGTMDGKHIEAAGLLGFRRPRTADRAQYSKLVDMRYRSDWLRWGNFGDHTGALSVSFARNVVAPLLCVKREKGRS